MGSIMLLTPRLPASPFRSGLDCPVVSGHSSYTLILPVVREDLVYRQAALT
jgi:hypothetical protein